MSETQALNCPGCGAPLALENRFSKTVVCSYCSQTSFVTPEGLDPTGRQARLADFPSILAIGKQGRLRGEEFKVLGRVRFKYDGGFWDEWLIALEGGTLGSRTLWLQEDEGEFTLFDKSALRSSVPPFDEIRVGGHVEVNGEKMFVTERCAAVIAGGEGELNFRFSPGQAVDCVDGNASGKLMSLEYSPDEILLSEGTPVEPDEIELGE